jgi:hypothetical protein
VSEEKVVVFSRLLTSEDSTGSAGMYQSFRAGETYAEACRNDSPSGLVFRESSGIQPYLDNFYPRVAYKGAGTAVKVWAKEVSGAAPFCICRQDPPTANCLFFFFKKEAAIQPWLDEHRPGTKYMGLLPEEAKEEEKVEKKPEVYLRRATAAERSGHSLADREFIVCLADGTVGDRTPPLNFRYGTTAEGRDHLTNTHCHSCVYKGRLPEAPVTSPDPRWLPGAEVRTGGYYWHRFDDTRPPSSYTVYWVDGGRYHGTTGSSGDLKASAGEWWGPLPPPGATLRAPLPEVLWTHDRPTSDGYYWYEADDAIRSICIQRVEGQFASDTYGVLCRHLDWLKGRWCGPAGPGAPLPPPPKAPPAWSATPPTQDGFYWLRIKDDDRLGPLVVRAVLKDCLAVTADFGTIPFTTLGAEWLGPITPEVSPRRSDVSVDLHTVSTTALEAELKRRAAAAKEEEARKEAARCAAREARKVEIECRKCTNAYGIRIASCSPCPDCGNTGRVTAWLTEPETDG